MQGAGNRKRTNCMQEGQYLIKKSDSKKLMSTRFRLWIWMIHERKISDKIIIFIFFTFPMAKSPNTIHRSRFLTRVPRILAMLFILFLTMFWFDMFGGEESIWIQIGGFLIHSIPSFILIAILIISRKHELVWAIAFMLAGLAYIVMCAINWVPRQMILWRSLTISWPALLTGILFRLSWRKKR